MTAFDPELYLRMLGEQELASGLDISHEEVNGRALLADAAAAFAVTGVIDAALAESIARDYRSADALRSGNLHLLRYLAAPGSTSDPRPLAPRQVYALERTVALDAGVKLLLHSLTVAEEEAWLAVEIYSEARFSHGPHGGPPSLEITTPSGRTPLGGFHGGWGDHHAEGRFSIPLPSADLSQGWFEVAGERITLTEPLAPPPVRIETFGADGLAVRYLWQLLSNVDRHGGPNLTSAVAALSAAGILDPADPELEALSWVAEHQEGRPRARHLRAGPSPSPPAIPDLVPESWRSLWSAQRPSRGPTGSIAVGALTPPFDGIRAAVNSLVSSTESFVIDVEIVGAGLGNGHPRMREANRTPLGWWASDDHGHHYLGHVNGWSGGSDHGQGQIEFGPLDPEAGELTLAITALNARALIPIALHWRR